MVDVYVILCTFPNKEEARQIGTLAVEMQLAACVNILPQMESIYRWEGKINFDSEILCVFKTSEACVLKLEEFLIAKHSYDVPEYLALKVDKGSKEYLKWLSGMVQ